jgi:murein DD-endopeptidase MepM/ murein hydrolase activator NlpD
MKTTRTYTAAATIAALTLASAGVVLRTDATSAAPRTDRSISTTRPATQSAPARPPRTPVDSTHYTYGWPVKPFHVQHAVRGFFGDPRVSNQGRTRQFHFGVDVSAPDGTPVYATLTGTATIHPLHASTVIVNGAGGIEFSYWHVVPTIRNGQRVVAYRTVIGRILEGQDHVHFSEARGGWYLNPLRPGAMGPFADDTRPYASRITTENAGRLVSPRARGSFDLVAELRDETPIAVPRPWHDLPVMPALVRWRLLGASGRAVVGWRTVVDFRKTIPQAWEYDSTWAPGATQNHVRMPGKYRVYLAHRVRNLEPGTYTVEVAARDTRDNRSVTRASFVVRSR